MKLKTLQQWICDTCGEIIADPSQGYVEWLTGEDRLAHGYRIVHHAPYSPIRKP
jgi:hypothetical protein